MNHDFICKNKTKCISEFQKLKELNLAFKSLALNSLYSSVALCQESETSEVLESLASFLRCLTDFSSSCKEEENPCIHLFCRAEYLKTLNLKNA